MPTLATGISVNNTLTAARARSAGFTLIELMVVVFIIGLITAAAVITFGGEQRDTELDREAERLDALFDYVREQAELQTRDYGFRVNNVGYSFVVFDVLQNQWRTADEDDALRQREFPEGLRAAGRGRWTTHRARSEKTRSRRVQTADHDLRQRRSDFVRNLAASRRRRREALASTPTNNWRSACCFRAKKNRKGRRYARPNDHETPCIGARLHAARGVDRARHRGDVSGRLAGHGHLLRQQRHLSQGQDAGRMGGAQSPDGIANRQEHAGPGKAQRKLRAGRHALGVGRGSRRATGQGIVAHRRARPCHRRGCR